MVKREEIMLDMNRFSVREEWIGYAKGDLPNNYSELAKMVVSDPMDIRHAHILYLAFISRGRGLHEGILDRIGKDNPHCVFPLNRAYAELVAYLIYCNQNPHYIDVMLRLGSERNRARKSITAIQDAIKNSAPGLKTVYDNLSRYTHFNEAGIYNSIRNSDEDPGKFSWTEYPRWKVEDDFKVACSQIHELSEGFTQHMALFAEKFLLNKSSTT